MPSIIQKKLYNSVKVFWIDKEILLENLQQSIASLVKEKPEVEKIILFGSIIEGEFIPSSDIDLILIVSESDKPFLDRSLPHLAFFQDVGCSIDMFVYTREEAEKGIALLEAAIKKAKLLFARR
jgi:predicted nucleotidyltransferase